MAGHHPSIQPHPAADGRWSVKIIHPPRVHMHTLSWRPLSGAGVGQVPRGGEKGRAGLCRSVPRQGAAEGVGSGQSSRGPAAKKGSSGGVVWWLQLLLCSPWGFLGVHLAAAMRGGAELVVGPNWCWG